MTDDSAQPTSQPPPAWAVPSAPAMPGTTPLGSAPTALGPEGRPGPTRPSGSSRRLLIGLAVAGVVVFAGGVLGGLVATRGGGDGAGTEAGSATGTADPATTNTSAATTSTDDTAVGGTTADGGAAEGDGSTDAGPSDGSTKIDPASPDVAVVIVGGLAIGGWGDGRWLSGAELPSTVLDGRTLRPLGAGTGSGAVDGPTQAPACELAGTALELFGEPGLSTDWNAVYVSERDGLAAPQAQVISPAPAHIDDARAALAQLGLNVDPQISRVLRFDIEGDGRAEVLIEASTLNADTLIRGGPDQYSILLLRRLAADDQVETVTIHASRGVDNSPYVAWAEAGALVDLDGDGGLDLVVAEQQYEGRFARVWTLGPQPTEVIADGCGA